MLNLKISTDDVGVPCVTVEDLASLAETLYIGRYLTCVLLVTVDCRACVPCL